MRALSGEGGGLSQGEDMVMVLWEGVQSFYLLGGAVPSLPFFGGGKGGRTECCTKSRSRLAKAKL